MAKGNDSKPTKNSESAFPLGIGDTIHTEKTERDGKSYTGYGWTAREAHEDRETKERTGDSDGGSSSSGSSGGDSGGSSSGCYVTTACVEHAGLRDDCRELQTMRKFRDGFVLSQPEGAALVGDYYRTAPLIVERIRRGRNAEAVFEALLTSTRKVVALVDAGENAEALVMCKGQFKKLKEEYIGQ